MVRSFKACAVLIVVCGVAIPAHAKDRKSAGADGERSALADMIVSREAHAKAMRQDASSASVERAAVVRSAGDRTSGNGNGAPEAPLREQQGATPSALSLKFGAVTLQPTVGGIKGAKFSIGF